jgi:DNA helicase II / ATP-dependent DNA helicase PcrA
MLASPDTETPNSAHLTELNTAQREAVAILDGPLLVLAGAGTGKTRVLTCRLAQLLLTGRALPHQILAVTFTNKAAREMRNRLEVLIGRGSEALWLGTFHAIGARILRRHAELIGLKSSFTILDADDQLRLLKQLIEADRIDTARWPARLLLGLIQRWKDRGLGPEQVSGAESELYAGGRARTLYTAYQERLRGANAVDFGDLLLLNLELFRKNPEVLAEYQRQFRYMLVDEYQDTNVSQYLWLRLLAQGHRNICCVGDDDQAIYGWRGAEVANILRFEHDFPGARIVRLERNYRSTGHILAAASGLIAHNRGRHGKTLFTEDEEGSEVVVRSVWDDAEEARMVGEEIEAIQRAGGALNKIAILVRAGFQTRAFEERFVEIALPYRVVGGPRFYERHEIRDAIAYMRVIAEPADDLAFERIVNVPRRGLGDATLQAMHALARAERIPLLAAAERLAGTDELRAGAKRSLATLAESFARWRRAVERLPHPELVSLVLNESGYNDMLRADRSPEAPGRLENLKELVRALEGFESLPDFLEHVSLVMDNDAAAGEARVNIMTLHSAKGLEFDSVFLPGWEEGLFPNQRAMDEGGMAALEEERRLAYVGITRARRRCDISFAATRRIYDQWQQSLPSRFIDELPVVHVRADNRMNLYRQPERPSWGAGAEPSGGPATLPPYRRAAAPSQTQRAPSGPAPAIGTRVFHQKFGYGRIDAVEGDKLDISFEKAGRKKVMASFVVAA